MFCCILCPRWHRIWLVKTCWECILCSRWCVRGLVNTRIGTFGLLTDIWGVWSTQMKIEIHLMSSLACDWFHQHKLRFILSSQLWERLCQHKLRHILCPRLHGSLGVWSTNVEMDLVSSLAWELFVQPLLRYVLSPRIQVVWSTHFEIHFVSSPV